MATLFFLCTWAGLMKQKERSNQVPAYRIARVPTAARSTCWAYPALMPSYLQLVPAYRTKRSDPWTRTRASAAPLSAQLVNCWRLLSSSSWLSLLLSLLYAVDRGYLVAGRLRFSLTLKLVRVQSLFPPPSTAPS